MKLYLGRVDDDLTQESIFAGVLVKKAPVHFVVPGELVTSAEKFGNEPQVEERILPIGLVHVAEVVFERESAYVEEGRGVLERIGQMWKRVCRVFETSQTL